jgi:uncharacterized protein
MAPKRQEVILLVDGYNVIGAWKDLYPNEETPLQQTHGEELEVARNKLIEQLINFSSFEGYLTTVVFDAHNPICHRSLDSQRLHLLHRV